MEEKNMTKSRAPSEESDKPVHPQSDQSLRYTLSTFYLSLQKNYRFNSMLFFIFNTFTVPVPC